jgi:hypothetical protein
MKGDLMMNIVSRITGILLRPKDEWQTISSEKTSVMDLYVGYLIPLAAIGPVASVIGQSIIGYSSPLVGTFRVSLQTSITGALVQFAMALVGAYVVALVIDALAPMFSGQKDLTQALKIAVYSGTPGYLVGIVALMPSLSALGLLGLYSLYLLYFGLGALMKSPADKALPYTVSVVVAVIVLAFVLTAAAAPFIARPMLGI